MVVGTAVLTSVVYIIADAGLGLTIWPATLIAFAVGFTFRFLAATAMEDPLPRTGAAAD